MTQREEAGLRILLLFSDTGGGHRAAAQALQQEFLAQNPRHQVYMEDILLRHTFWPLRESDRFYFWAVTKAPWFWKVFYHTTALPLIFPSLYRPLSLVLTSRFQRLYDLYRPHLVVSLHPLLNHLPRQVLRRWEQRHARPRTPFATVITDLTTFHPSWVDPQVDLITVATEEARARVLRLGAAAHKVRVLGLPVRAAFRTLPRDRSALRRQLGLEDALPVVLLMAGGQGMGPVEAIAQALAMARVRAQLVIVAGRNRELKDRLQAKSWPIPTRVLGFVDHIHLWMKASDILLTKAGPGTIAEALICGLPMIIYSYIPGQERGNVDFVVRHEVGTYVSEPAKIAEVVQSWLAQPGVLHAMRERAHTLGRPAATRDIVSALLSLTDASRCGARPSSVEIYPGSSHSPSPVSPPSRTSRQ